MIGTQEVADLFIGAVIDQQRTEQPLLRVLVVRQDAII